MTLVHGALVFAAAAIAGALNSVAGGGSFVSFPTLLSIGVPAVSANATNTVALWPAGLASVAAYRRELRQPTRVLLSLGAASLVGGAAGAVLLLRTPETTFQKLIPYLILAATLVFTFGSRLKTRRAGLGVATGMQLVIAVYGGYFGGGMGILMLATLTLLGMTNIHEMNALKTLLGSFINGVAVAAFAIAGAVRWAPGAVMIVGASAGAYVAAAGARRINPKWVRRMVLVLAWGMTAYFFARAYVLEGV